MSTRLIAGSPLQKNGTFTSDLYPDVCYINNVSSNGIINSKFYPSDFSIPLLLLQVTVVIIITNIVRFILKPLKQPTFVSHVIGGLLVGPSGLGRLETFSNVVFPQTSLNVMKIGTVIGAIYYVFIIGVKQDPKVMLNRGRKTLAIATLGAILPLALIISIFSMALFITDSVGGKRFQKYFYLGVLLSLSSFSNLIPILTELKLLNSKLGRLAISVSMNHSMVQCLVLFIYGVMKNSSQPYALVGYIVSMLAIIIFTFFIVRPLLFMVIHRTLEGEPVDNIYIIAILLGVLVIESINNIVGGTTLTGAMFFGLAMPEGPPLGAALVKKSETIVQIFFLPLVYAAVGLKTDVFAIHNLKSWMNLQSLLIIGYMAKTVGIVLSCRHFKMPIRDALSLSLIMNFSELPHLMSLVKANEYKLLGDQSYTHLVLAILVMTAIAAPLVKYFNRHTKLYMAYGLRTIEHSKPNAELRIVTCISSKDNAPPMIELLETSHATRESPLFVWNINLVELEGRAAPMLISHNFHRNSSSSMAPHIRQINNAFQICEQRNGKWFSIQTFTSVSPCQTMYQDVCMLALDKKASLLIMPFYRRIDGSVDQTLRILNSKILDEAPCSVGILIEHELHCNSIMTNSSFYHICVIFIGGADDREALSYGLRMAGHWCVRLDVVRILSSYDGNMVDDRMRLLDDEFIAIFRIKCAGNERVAYRVELVNDCVDTINVIQRMKNLYSLMLVGRRHERNSTPVQGLSQWCENPELGVIGDFLVSSDFSEGMVSVLVLQQQINVGLTVLNGHQQHIPQVNSGFAMSFY
ncbi:cation/H+ antiporter 15-like protein [Cinnamomum micranthum f. kanehirae]|uniref:Cation/H+ antiporter 15-like protein n=1 Tax=Cinnamomum micranthum f. kanehirae TaxID=337451 RepID=A0A443PR45_9MAGN|nr:cation/H+ antiporter 15-like protein [Cinnamomum micranthum f. kanehirae]